MDFEKEIKDLVCEIIEMEQDALDPDASFSDDLGIDSLRALEILAAIENKFSITIEPEKLKDMTTLNKVIEVARNCLE